MWVKVLLKKQSVCVAVISISITVNSLPGKGGSSKVESQAEYQEDEIFFHKLIVAVWQ